MDNPGAFQLTQNGAGFAITGPAAIVGDVLAGFEGIQSLSLQAAFQYGGGGTNVIAYIQTSTDQGQNWIDIAAFEFETSGGALVVNLSGSTPRTTPVAPTNGELTPGTCVDGILGDRFRAVVELTGTYNNSTLLNLTAVAR